MLSRGPDLSGRPGCSPHGRPGPPGWVSLRLITVDQVIGADRGLRGPVRLKPGPGVVAVTVNM